MGKGERPYCEKEHAIFSYESLSITSWYFISNDYKKAHKRHSSTAWNRYRAEGMRVILFISIEKLSEGGLVRLLCCKVLTIPRDIHVLYFLIQRGFPEYKTHSSYSFPVNESPLVYDNDLRIDRKTHSFHRLSTKYSSVLVINSLRPTGHRQRTNIALTRTKFLMQYKMRLRCR